MTTGSASGYETPIWTLIGVAIGFGLSYLYTVGVQRREYNSRVTEAVERIKKSMHLSGSGDAIRRIADLVPQFRDREQIKVLSEVGFESSLNASMDDVTKCVIAELRWLCVSYEVFRRGDDWLQASGRDERRVRLVQDTLWEILVQVVEYTQSSRLLDVGFGLAEVLDRYSVAQAYRRATEHAIGLYSALAAAAVRVQYGESGRNGIDLRSAIDDSVRRLHCLRDSLRGSSFDASIVQELSLEVDRATESIEAERAGRHPAGVSSNG